MNKPSVAKTSLIIAVSLLAALIAVIGPGSSVPDSYAGGSKKSKKVCGELTFQKKPYSGGKLVVTNLGCKKARQIVRKCGNRGVLPTYPQGQSFWQARLPERNLLIIDTVTPNNKLKRATVFMRGKGTPKKIDQCL